MVHGITRKSSGLMNAHGLQSQLNLAQTPAQANENLRKTAKLLNETHRIRNLQIHMTIQIGRVTVRTKTTVRMAFIFLESLSRLCASKQ